MHAIMSLIFYSLVVASLFCFDVNGDVQFQCSIPEYCLDASVQHECEVLASAFLRWSITNEKTVLLGQLSYTIDQNLVKTVMFPNNPPFYTDLTSSSYPRLTSSISFTVQSSINGYTIQCEDFEGNMKNCTINIADVPVPQNVNIQFTSSSSVSISWTESSSDCVTGYRYNVSSTATTIVQSISDPAVTTVTVEGLVPSDDQYCVVVTTIDTANRSSSDSDTVCLYFNVPPPVDSVNASNTSVSDTEAEVVVTWEPVENSTEYNNAPSFQYHVSIFNSTDPDDFSRVATVSSDTTTHTFTVLKGKTYNVTVLATNVIGEGTLAHTTIVVSGPIVIPTTTTTSSPTETSSMKLTESSSIAPPSTTINTVPTSPTLPPVDPSKEGVPTTVIGASAGIAVLVIVAVLLFLLCFLCKKKLHSAVNRLIGSTKRGDKDGSIPMKETN